MRRSSSPTSPEIVFFSTITMAEMPFALLTILALWRLERAMIAPPAPAKEFVTGVALGASLLCRTLGATFVFAGLALLAARRRRLAWTTVGALAAAAPSACPVVWSLGASRTGGSDWFLHGLRGRVDSYCRFGPGVGSQLQHLELARGHTVEHSPRHHGGAPWFGRITDARVGDSGAGCLGRSRERLGPQTTVGVVPGGICSRRNRLALAAGPISRAGLPLPRRVPRTALRAGWRVTRRLVSDRLLTVARSRSPSPLSQSEQTSQRSLAGQPPVAKRVTH